MLGEQGALWDPVKLGQPCSNCSRVAPQRASEAQQLPQVRLEGHQGKMLPLSSEPFPPPTQRSWGRQTDLPLFGKGLSPIRG